MAPSVQKDGGVWIIEDIKSVPRYNPGQQALGILVEAGGCDLVSPTDPFHPPSFCASEFS